MSQNKNLIVGALIGGVIGSLAGLLLAPKSGEQLRGDFLNRYKLSPKKGSIAKSKTLWGSVAGGLAALATALVINPQRRNRIRRNVLNRYHQLTAQGKNHLHELANGTKRPKVHRTRTRVSASKKT